MRRATLLTLLGPGILIAATGVGAGDLLTASLAGSKLGLTVLWAAWLGAILKWLMNEGIARWQMATGTTLLEGWVERLGGWIQWVFMAYLLVWTFFTGGALVNACGVAGTGLLPLAEDERVSKIVWGAIHALVGAVLVRVGGFRLFERMMSACIGVMFVAVMLTALLSRPDWDVLWRGLTVPRIPEGGLDYVLGILGGVGGTVTLLSYGYWIREAGRLGKGGLRACRIDLAVGYLMTALFGIAMVVIGSRTDLERGPRVALTLAEQLGVSLGSMGEWVFLIGFWGAVFSSLLGVWQGVPYLFADFLLIRRGTPADERAGLDFTRTRAYRVYLVLIAVVPLPLLWISVERAQLAYAVLGAFFMPLLALTLLLMNNRGSWVGERFRNRWPTNLALIATLAFFVYAGIDTAVDKLGKMFGGP